MTNYELEKHLHQLENEKKRLRLEVKRLGEISDVSGNYYKSFERRTRRGLRTPHPGESTFKNYYKALSKSIGNIKRAQSVLKSSINLNKHINKTQNALLLKYHVPKSGGRVFVNRRRVAKKIVTNAKKNIRKTAAEYELLKKFHPSIVKNIMNRMN